MAFSKDFETFYQTNNDKSRMCCGDGEHVAYSVDTWDLVGGYTVMVSAGSLLDMAVWRHIWDTQVFLLLWFELH